jgi:hypothetical protein
LLIEAEREFDPALRGDDPEANKVLEEFFTKMKSQLPFLDDNKEPLYGIPVLLNVNLSRCYNCKDISLWLADRLIYPVKGEAPPPSVDLPADIFSDYLEASAILDLSPRGAAALVRLCIQKLCKHLGQPGENINADIKALVAAGLDSRVQKALDAVRVIGNNAVHPGSMDLSDDRATAESLFKLLNLIVEKMISEPKHVDEVYASLPPGARAAIEARDKIS